MAIYNRYEKLQKYYLGQPVVPAIYKKGDFVSSYETNDIGDCEVALVWMETDGYICEVQTDGETYSKYKKLLGYHSDGTPTNPEIYKKGDLISSDCKLETCGEDIMFVEYDPDNNKVYTKKTIDCGNTFDIIDEKTYDTVEANATYIGENRADRHFIANGDNLYYIREIGDSSNSSFILASVDKETGVSEEIARTIDSNGEIADWVNDFYYPFSFNTNPYFDGINLYLFKLWRKRTTSQLTIAYNQVGLSMLVYNINTNEYIITDKIYSDEKIYDTTEMIGLTFIQAKIFVNANEVIVPFARYNGDTKESDGSLFFQRFKYNELGDIVPSKFHYFNIPNAFVFDDFCINYHTNELVIPFKKNNPLYSKKSTIQYNYYRYVASLPKTQDEDIVEIRIDDGWVYDITDGGEYIYKWATPAFIYGNNNAFHKSGNSPGIDITNTRDFFIENDTNKTFTIYNDIITEIDGDKFNSPLKIDSWVEWYNCNDLLIAYLKILIRNSGTTFGKTYIFKID